MNRVTWIVISLGYIVGLLSSGLFYFDTLNPTGFDLVIIAVGLFFIGTLLAVITKKYFKIQHQVWLVTVAIAFLGVTYFQLRIVQPQVDNISYQVSSKTGSELVTIQGKVIDEPRLSSKDKIKFVLEAKKVSILEEKQSNLAPQELVSGKVYVTIPLSPNKKIYPGQIVTIQGILYLPSSPSNPGQFNFKNYLAHQGIFAGLKGIKVSYDPSQIQPSYSLSKLRQRILKAQVKGLGSPWGQLLTSIVLGRNAVDLPEDIRDLFIKAGLAHVLAASGFHVSLLLGIVLKLTNSLASKSRLIIGIVVLLIYASLTGFSPSIIRASFMGIAVLIAAVTNSKVRPLASLFLIALIILIINPLWIWNLSFQLSFLATLGLIVTVPSIEKKLDWIPPTIAVAIAFPLAAIIWTLPLTSYYFNTVATYSILINIITTPLVTIISLGGMISGFLSLVFPPLGSIIAWLLFYPILVLTQVIQFLTNLPGSNFTLGTISLVSVITIYIAIAFLCFNFKQQKYSLILLILSLTLTTVPIFYSNFKLTQITILATRPTSTIVIQDQGKNIIISSSQTQNDKYTLLPFLAHQGINNIDYAIAFNPESNLPELITNIQPKLLTTNSQSWQELTLQQPIITNFLTINALTNNIQGLKIIGKNQTWLIIPNPNQATFNYLKKNLEPNTTNTLICWKNNLDTSWLIDLPWQTVVASISKPNLQSQSITFYNPNEEGAITWKPQSGFTTPFGLK